MTTAGLHTYAAAIGPQAHTQPPAHRTATNGNDGPPCTDGTVNGAARACTAPSFREALARTQARTPPNGEPAALVQKHLEGLIEGFTQLRDRERLLLQKLPSGIKPLFEAQLLSERLQLQSQLISKTADAVAGTVRRLGQLGGGG